MKRDCIKQRSTAEPQRAQRDERKGGRGYRTISAFACGFFFILLRDLCASAVNRNLGGVEYRLNALTGSFQQNSGKKIRS